MVNHTSTDGTSAPQILWPTTPCPGASNSAPLLSRCEKQNTPVFPFPLASRGIGRLLAHRVKHHTRVEVVTGHQNESELNLTAVAS